MAGSKNVNARWVSGDLVIYNASGTELFRIGTSGIIQGSVERVIRTRFTIAQINAGATLLAAIAGFKYRMIAATAIAYGGAVGAVTTVDLLATQSAASVKLVAFAQASLTQSTELSSGASGAAVLTDGASHVANDANTAITISKTGSDLTTATGVDIVFRYTIES